MIHDYESTDYESDFSLWGKAIALTEGNPWLHVQVKIYDAPHNMRALILQFLSIHGKNFHNASNYLFYINVLLLKISHNDGYQFLT